MKLALRIAWLALGALLLAAALLFGLLGTERGTRWLAAEAQLLSGGVVTLGEVRGTFLEGVQASELRVVAGKVEIIASEVGLVVQPADLLRGRLALTALSAAKLQINVAKSETPDEPFVMPTISLPFALEVGELDVREVELRIGEELRAASDIVIAGRMRDSRLEITAASGRLSNLDLKIAGRVDLEPGLPLDATVEWRLSDALPQSVSQTSDQSENEGESQRAGESQSEGERRAPISGSGTVRGELEALVIEQLVRVPDEIRLSATLKNITSQPKVEATARWASLSYDVPGIGAVRAEPGEAQLEGWLDAWRVRLSTSLQGEMLPPMTVRGAAAGDRQKARIAELRADGAFGSVTAQGDAVLDGPRVKLDVVARNIDTAALREGWKGRVSARFALDAHPSAVDVAIRELDGRLMGRALSGRGNLSWRDGTLALRDVNIRAGANRLQANATVGERLAGTIHLDAPELGVLWPDLSGQLTADAKLAGTRAQPVVDLRASATALRLDANRVQSLELELRSNRSRRVDAKLQARGLQSGERALGDLDAEVAGTLASHRLTARLTGGIAEVELASSGSWNGTTLRHRLESAEVSEPTLGAWELNGEPEVSLRASAAQVGPHCWSQAPTLFCIAQLDWSSASTHVIAEVQDLELQRLDRWLAQDFAVTGLADGRADVEIAGNVVLGAANARLEDATLYYTGGDEPLVTTFNVARFEARFERDAATAVLELDSQEGLHLSGNARVESPLSADAPLYAEVVGRLPDVAPLVPLLAGDYDLAEVAGSIALDATISGTLRVPQLTGVIRLSDGAVALSDIGVKVEDIDIALLGDGSDTLRLQGSAKAGGPLTLSGEVEPLNENGPQGWVRVRGNRIDAVRLPDRFVQVSPNITVTYDAGDVTTEGIVTIPKADILIRELPASAASPSPDVVIRDRDVAVTSDPGRRRVGGEIQLVFGRDVRLRGFGLDTLLEGTVKLSQGADFEPQGYGVVRLKEGKFGAYGKELQIERGTLGFAGPLDDPAVDLRASRRIDYEGKNVTAGILLSGTAKRPESRVYSTPAMSEADALSYLISGRPMQSANANDRSSIAGAALALGVQQTSPLTQAVGSAITLDELGMQGGTFDETEVVAGKQVTGDLYVRFTYGLFSRIGTVLARYKIGRNLSLEAASGEDQSLDLIWSVERD